MICEDLDRVGSSFDVDSPLSEPLDHREEFFVVDGVVELGRGKLAGVEADGVKNASWGRLREDAAQGEVGRIGFDREGELRLEVLEDGSGGEGGLELAEGSLCLCRPGKFDSLPSQSRKRSSEGRVVKNEFAIEIGEPQE